MCPSSYHPHYPLQVSLFCYCSNHLLPRRHSHPSPEHSHTSPISKNASCEASWKGRGYGGYVSTFVRTSGAAPVAAGAFRGAVAWSVGQDHVVVEVRRPLLRLLLLAALLLVLYIAVMFLETNAVSASPTSNSKKFPATAQAPVTPLVLATRRSSQRAPTSHSAGHDHSTTGDGTARQSESQLMRSTTTFPRLRTSSLSSRTGPFNLHSVNDVIPAPSLTLSGPDRADVVPSDLPFNHLTTSPPGVSSSSPSLTPPTHPTTASLDTSSSRSPRHLLSPLTAEDCCLRRPSSCHQAPTPSLNPLAASAGKKQSAADPRVMAQRRHRELQPQEETTAAPGNTLYWLKQYGVPSRLPPAAWCTNLPPSKGSLGGRVVEEQSERRAAPDVLDRLPPDVPRIFVAIPAGGRMRDSGRPPRAEMGEINDTDRAGGDGVGQKWKDGKLWGCNGVYVKDYFETATGPVGAWVNSLPYPEYYSSDDQTGDVAADPFGHANCQSQYLSQMAFRVDTAAFSYFSVVFRPPDRRAAVVVTCACQQETGVCTPTAQWEADTAGNDKLEDNDEGRQPDKDRADDDRHNRVLRATDTERVRSGGGGDKPKDVDNTNGEEEAVSVMKELKADGELSMESKDDGVVGHSRGGGFVLTGSAIVGEGNNILISNKDNALLLESHYRGSNLYPWPWNCVAMCGAGRLSPDCLQPIIVNGCPVSSLLNFTVHRSSRKSSPSSGNSCTTQTDSNPHGQCPGQIVFSLTPFSFESDIREKGHVEPMTIKCEMRLHEVPATAAQFCSTSSPRPPPSSLRQSVSETYPHRQHQSSQDRQTKRPFRRPQKQQPRKVTNNHKRQQTPAGKWPTSLSEQGYARHSVGLQKHPTASRERQPQRHLASLPSAQPNSVPIQAISSEVHQRCRRTQREGAWVAVCGGGPSGPRVIRRKFILRHKRSEGERMQMKANRRGRRKRRNPTSKSPHSDRVESHDVSTMRRRRLGPGGFTDAYGNDLLDFQYEMNEKTARREVDEYRRFRPQSGHSREPSTITRRPHDWSLRNAAVKEKGNSGGVFGGDRGEIVGTDAMRSFTSNDGSADGGTGGMMVGSGQRYIPQRVEDRFVQSVHNQVVYDKWTADWSRNTAEKRTSVRAGNDVAIVGGLVDLKNKASAASAAFGSSLVKVKQNQVAESAGFAFERRGYVVDISRSNLKKATTAKIAARNVETATMIDLADRDYGQRVKVRNFDMTVRHDFDEYIRPNPGSLATELGMFYRTLSVVVGTDVKDARYLVSVNLRGYQILTERDFDQRQTTFQGNWGNGWQTVFKSNFVDELSDAMYGEVGFGKLNRLYVRAGAGVGDDGMPEGAAEIQTSDVVLGVNFRDTGGSRQFVYNVKLGKFSYVWESKVVPDNLNIPLVFGVDPSSVMHLLPHVAAG
eukprot:GHVS01066643.1.p1 GENE.GHVS01066643.1~~GHVS01066643.1.p1  ORF type:complete len:1407 (-),score=217.45 GHVS01066643.1:294-4514(-)